MAVKFDNPTFVREYGRKPDVAWSGEQPPVRSENDYLAAILTIDLKERAFDVSDPDEYRRVYSRYNSNKDRAGFEIYFLDKGLVTARTVAQRAP